MSREACSELVAVAATREASLGVRLLGDLRDIFSTEEALATEEILVALHKLEEAPWGNLRGQPLDARGLARLLRSYGTTSTKIKRDGRPLQGYRRRDLWDAFGRYLPQPVASAEPTEHPDPTEMIRRAVPWVPEVPENENRRGLTAVGVTIPG